jgi:hypothetical protein
MVLERWALGSNSNTITRTNWSHYWNQESTCNFETSVQQVLTCEWKQRPHKMKAQYDTTQSKQITYPTICMCQYHQNEGSPSSTSRGGEHHYRSSSPCSSCGITCLECMDGLGITWLLHRGRSTWCGDGGGGGGNFMPIEEVDTVAGAAPMTLSSVRMLVDADIFLYQLCEMNPFLLEPRW